MYVCPKNAGYNNVFVLREARVSVGKGDIGRNVSAILPWLCLCIEQKVVKKKALQWNDRRSERIR